MEHTYLLEFVKNPDEFVMYYFLAPYNNRKSFQMSTIRLNRKCSKVVGISSDIFGNVRKPSENRWKSSEVAQTFSDIPVMMRQKSHAFDSEKVSRYTLMAFFTRKNFRACTLVDC